MSTTPLVVERILNAPIASVWAALTDVEKMKQWYFDFQGFKLEVGCEFHFTAGDECNSYLHLCRVMELVPGTKITYSWRYDKYTGDSFVTFELFAEGDKTKLVLTHRDLESFPSDAPELARKSFEGGWSHIINIALPAFVEVPTPQQ